MDRTPVTCGGHVDLARVGFGICDEFGNSPGRDRGMDHHNVRYAEDAADRRDVTNEIVVELFIERCIDCSARADQEQRIAIRGCLSDRFHGDIRAGSWAVLYDE